MWNYFLICLYALISDIFVFRYEFHHGSLMDLRVDAILNFFPNENKTAEGKMLINMASNLAKHSQSYSAPISHIKQGSN